MNAYTPIFDQFTNGLISGYRKENKVNTAERQIAKAGWLYCNLAADQATWSQATFGKDSERGPVGALKHLAKEAAEALSNPEDASEYADCLLLTLDAARRAGIGPIRLLECAQQKMEVNKSRDWPKPTSDEPVEHLK
jgi:hypothetical protein